MIVGVGVVGIQKDKEGHTHGREYLYEADAKLTVLGLKDELGTIEPGKLADLLVVTGNPAKDVTVLQDRANLNVIMKGGQFVECQLTPSKTRLQKAA